MKRLRKGGNEKEQSFMFKGLERRWLKLYKERDSQRIVKGKQMVEV